MRSAIPSAAVICALGAFLTSARRAAPSRGAPAARPEVFVLGTFHMANPGHDINNMHVDDVLSEARQAQIAQVVAVLERFRPTKIAIESDVTNDAVPVRYREYLADRHELTRNEIEQLGFRLARQLGHPTIYAVDADGDFPWPRLSDYAKAHSVALFDSVSNEFAQYTKEMDAYLASHTILETLSRTNADSIVALTSGTYARIGHIGEPWDWAGPDLLADWYRRNIRIYNNVTRLITSPEDRVLVIFGYGHLALLRQDFAADPTLRLRRLADFAP
jgi:hypothetical protein